MIAFVLRRPPLSALVTAALLAVTSVPAQVVWSIGSGGPKPPPRDNHGMAYDSAHLSFSAITVPPLSGGGFGFRKRQPCRTRGPCRARCLACRGLPGLFRFRGTGRTRF